MSDAASSAKPAKPLPKFKPRALSSVQKLLSNVLTNPTVGEQSQLVSIDEYPDGHYRAWFSRNYFVLAEDATEPSKSQWNTLKKKLKRHDARAFVFKEYGSEVRDGETLDYLDFGFFAH
jgi:hypothetical protein